jgi:hypothetical protein
MAGHLTSHAADLVARLGTSRVAGESVKSSSSEAITIGVWVWPTDYFDTAHMFLQDNFLEVRSTGVNIRNRFLLPPCPPPPRHCHHVRCHHHRHQHQHNHSTALVLLLLHDSTC